MTKQAFLSELRQRLGDVDEAKRNEVCTDMEGHFAEGKARGHSEEEICRGLGQPSVIAARLTEKYAGYVKTNSDAQTEGDSFDASVRHFTRSVAAAAQSAVAVASSIVGDLFSSGGAAAADIDLDRSFADVRDITIKLDDSSLTLCPAEQSDAVRVTVRGPSRHNMFRAETHDGELVIMEEAPRFRFALLFSGEKPDTVVYVPAGFAGNITANVLNGRTDVHDIRGNQLSLKNANGNTVMERCDFNTITARASVGKINAKQLNANAINLRSSAGNADIEDSRGELDIHSSAGNIRVTRHSGRKIKANASAGSVSVAESAAEINAHSSAGTVDIRCENFTLPNVRAESSAGSVRVSAAESDGLQLSSSAGTIRMRVGRLAGDAVLSAGAGSIHAEIGAVNGNVRAKSSMGSVKIKLPSPAGCRIEASAIMGGVRNSTVQTEDSPYTVRAESQMGSVVIGTL